MQGFNHYDDFPCGWCVNYGRMSYSQRRAWETDMRLRDAAGELKRASSRSISGCYVNPNAKCPECGAGVFFYANEHGSRVFFDDIGHPWPKHPCTDLPRGYVPSGPKPTRRARGITKELVEAANVVGLFKGREFGLRAVDDLSLLLVLEVSRAGRRNLVVAEFVDSTTNETTSFRCFSDDPLFEPGDLVNKKGEEISFLHRSILMPVVFRIGLEVNTPVAAADNLRSGRGARRPPVRIAVARMRRLAARRKENDLQTPLRSRSAAKNYNLTTAYLIDSALFGKRGNPSQRCSGKRVSGFLKMRESRSNPSQRYLGQTLGVDLNADHVALTLDATGAPLTCVPGAPGKPVMTRRIDLVSYGKTRAQRLDMIRKAAAEIAALAARLGVPVAAEKLDFKRKRAELEARNGKKRARMLSSFAYSSFAEALARVCVRRSVRLVLVNPAYTSIIGLVKFAPRYGSSVHAAAALAIARRAMALSERLPAFGGGIPVFLASGDRVTLPRPVRIAQRHVWSSWSRLSRGLSAVHEGRR